MKLTPEQYLGDFAKKKIIDNFCLSITTHKRKSEIPYHSHENPYISINLGSDYLEVETTSKTLIKSGHAISRPANYEHHNTFSWDSGICFNIEILKTENLDSEINFNKIEIRKTNIDLYKILAAFVGNNREDEIAIMIDEYFLLLDDNCSISKTPEWYHTVVDYIYACHETSITLKRLAEICQMHPNYICRQFKNICGVTISQFIRNVRIEKAFNMLTNEPNSLTQIGLQAGFYDQSHFTKIFKSTIGTNPQKFQSDYKRLISYNLS